MLHLRCAIRIDGEHIRRRRSVLASRGLSLAREGSSAQITSMKVAISFVLCGCALTQARRREGRENPRKKSRDFDNPGRNRSPEAPIRPVLVGSQAEDR
jgi:hypothetical protein